MSEYTQVDLQIGTEEQFETKKANLPEGVLVGLTDPIHENELDSALQTKLNNKVDKITGKGLSTNDFTDAEKGKLAGIEAEAQVNVIETIIPGENVTVSKSGKTVTISATGGGGTAVVANPTLAGTEADLTGLSVNGTKYKVPAGNTFTVTENADGTVDLTIE